MQRLSITVLSLVVAVLATPVDGWPTSYSMLFLANPGNADTSPEWGDAVAIAGDTVAVGNPQGYGGGEDGTVTLFDAVDGHVIGQLHDPSPERENYFGGSLAAIDGKLLITALDESAVYLYDPAVRTFVRTFRPADGGEGFGRSVAVMGGDVLVGALSGGPNGWGAVYRFDASTGALVQTYLRTTPQGIRGFGISVAAVGSNVLVGELGDDSVGYATGAAYLFDGATGALLTTIPTPGTAPYDWFGYQVGALGDAVLVAAPSPQYIGSTGLGRVYVFDQSGTLLRTIEDPDPVGRRSFGFAMAPFDGGVLVGAPLNNGFGTEAVYRFDAAGSLADTFSYVPYSTRFGQSVAIQNDTIAVGGGRLEGFLLEPCGNGKAAAAEQCDDGNEVSGDGCSDQCRSELCPPTPAPDCTAPPAANVSSLRVSMGRKPRLDWTWRGPGTSTDFGAPNHGDGYLLCAYVPSQPMRAYSAPAGARWRPAGTVGFTFGSGSGMPDGLLAAKLRASNGRATIAVHGAGFWLAPPALPLATPVRVQLHRAGMPSRCWEATYGTHVSHNDAGTFRARNDAP